jgi:CTP:molybdopterin cytidylyltransferase MocA
MASNLASSRRWNGEIPADGLRRKGVMGAVLAAGQSSRMGSPKALLEWNGRTFIERAVRALLDGGCAGVIAVVGDGHDRAARLAEAAGATVVVNPDPGSTQLDSLRLAVLASRGAAGIAMLPVDHPAVRAETVARVLDQFRPEADIKVVRPIYDGRGGHPTLFSSSSFELLLGGALRGGARELVHACANETVEVPVLDMGSRFDVDTPDDLRRLRELLSTATQRSHP